MLREPGSHNKAPLAPLLFGPGLCTYRWLLRLAAVLLAAAPAAPQAAAVSWVDGEVLVEGQLMPGDARAVQRLLGLGRRTLRIHSPGGDMAEALAIGKALRQQGMQVRVNGLCASACALLLLPGASSVAVDDGSVVALHAAGHGAWLAAEREGVLRGQGSAIDQMSSKMLGITREASEFLRDAGIQMWMVDFMYRLTSVAEIKVDWQERAGQEPALVLTGTRRPICKAWVMTSQTLAAMGIKVTSWQPAGMLVSASVLNEPMEELYAGPALGDLDPGIGTCSALRLVVEPTPGR